MSGAEVGAALNVLGIPILTLVTFLPLVAALVLLFIPSAKTGLIRWFTFFATLVTFLASIPLATQFHTGQRGMQFVERASWVPSLGIQYFMGVDGVSVLLIVMTTFLSAVAVLSSFSAITEKLKAYMGLLLVLETGMIGVFAALDLVLFYMFWEVVLIPMYLLIGVWGGPRRIYASVKFILYTVVGSLLMLVGILYLYFQHHAAFGEYTFDLIRLYDTPLGHGPQLWLFAAFALAFAIKVPMFPFHTWLPDAHVEAPTAGSVILAGVLLKMGTYGFFRFAMPLFPEGAMAFAPVVIALAVIGIIYGALVAMVQSDVKKLVAYSSVSHLGFVMVGLFALNTQGIQGSVLQMVNHGLSTGALFLAVGVLYERRHTREIKDFGGISEIMPWFAAFFLIVSLSSLGLPGLNGFIGEFLILLGTFRMNHWVAGIAAIGVILGAVYLLWMFQRVMFGPVTNEKNRGLPDLTRREFWVLAPLILIIIWIGVYPNTFLRFLDSPAAELMERMSSRTVAARSFTPNEIGDVQQSEDDAIVESADSTEGTINLGAIAAGAGVGVPPDSTGPVPIEPATPPPPKPPAGSPGRVTP